MSTAEVLTVKKMPYWINDNRVELVASNIICDPGKPEPVPVEVTEKGAMIEDIFWVITSDPNNKALSICQKMPKKLSGNKWDFKTWEVVFFNHSTNPITFDLYVQVLHKAGTIEVEI
ncbi:hypothetical protein [Paenibacillus sp. O199]|uniref:hypothetical protein n=1 Tax=Paenibacillus sp. O199 TaxID=1643925 RepID=UPI0007BF57A4|nr:hypothetical protein [Paenibacillus sp. O199]